MTNTADIRKKKTDLIWGAGKVVIGATIVGLFGWLFSTVDSLQTQVGALESNRRENEAQWRVLSETSKRLEKTEKHVEVYKTLFKMLLDQNKIDVTTVTIEEKKIKETKAKPLTLFKKEQMREYNKDMIRQMK